MSAPSIDHLYQRIGEYVVSFQWLEGRIRDVGWLLFDPDRRGPLPDELQDITNRALLDKVNKLYESVVGGFGGPGAFEYCKAFASVINDAHDVRRDRNSLLHSAYSELKSGEEVFALIRTDLRAASGGMTDLLSDEHLSELMRRLARVGVAVNFHHVQLTHWAPFSPPPFVQSCGLKNIGDLVG